MPEKRDDDKDGDNDRKGGGEGGRDARAGTIVEEGTMIEMEGGGGSE